MGVSTVNPPLFTRDPTPADQLGQNSTAACYLLPLLFGAHIFPPANEAVGVAMDVHSDSLNVRFWSRRETLLRPVLWSLEDLRLFGCRFGDIHTSQLQGHVDTPVEDSSAATGPDALRRREALTLQNCRASPFVKEGCMVNILCDDNFYAWCRARPPLRIGKRTIPGAPYVLFRPVEQHPACRDLPWAGYMDYCLINSARREGNRRKLRPGQRDNDFFTRLKRITPRDWSEDPYVLFILLSIAQRQYYHKHARHNTTYQVYISTTMPTKHYTNSSQACLFITNPASPQDIILFDADIPTALLDELDDPRMVPQRRTRLVIHRTRMSIEPRKDFLARLVAALSSRADDDAADGEGWGGGEGCGDRGGRGDRADEEGSGRQET
ncbi:hypothetical protein ARSEF1564_005073 [Beauveria bassiana]